MSQMLDDMATEIRARLKELERERVELTRFLTAIEPAPFGYKSDGTPRKRPAPKRKVKSKDVMKRMRQTEKVRLHVQTVGTPTEAEMEGREVAHVTSE